MKIEVRPGVFWDTESQEQSTEAIEWYQTQVLPKLDPNMAELDVFKRPYWWTINMGTCIVSVIAQYATQSSSWALDKYNIEVKEVM